MPSVDIQAVRAHLRTATPPEVQLIVLFGSAAKGLTTRRSDVDVAVLCERAADFDGLFLALAPAFGTERLDLVDLRHAAPTLAFQVAREGVLLFERQPARYHEFQALASRRYADTRKLRDAQAQAISAFLRRPAR